MKKFLPIVFCSVLAACSAAPTAQSDLQSSSTVQNSGLSNQKPKANPAQAVKFSVEKAVEIRAGNIGEAVLKLRVVEPFHVNSNPPSEKSYIPLEVQFENQNGVFVEKPVYPAGEMKKFAFAEDKPLSVYTGETVIGLPLKIEPTAVKGARQLMGKISFQPCDDEVCYRPQTIEVQFPVTIN